MSIKHLYLIAVAAILGCAPSSPPATSGSAVAPRKGNLLTAAEIVVAKADVGTVSEALLRLRPVWLAPRGGGSSFGAAGTDFPVVYVDGQQYGDLNSLRTLHAYQVAEIRYYTPAEAGGIFGVRGGNAGVIDVRMHLKRQE